MPYTVYNIDIPSFSIDIILCQSEIDTDGDGIYRYPGIDIDIDSIM